MYASLERTPEAAIINLGGRFDFTGQQAFAKCCERALEPANCRRIDIDLGAVDSLDDAALCMLLVLKERAEGLGLPVSLLNCHGAVRQALDTAAFGTLFTIR